MPKSDQTHDLLFEMIGVGRDGPLQNMVPTVQMSRFAFLTLLSQCGDPKAAIATFCERIKPFVETKFREFEREEAGKDVDDLTSVANAARGVWRWIYEIENALELPDKIEMIVKAVGPMAWLDTLTKTLELRSMIRQVRA